MNPSTWAGVITAVGVFITALVGVAGAITNWVATNRARQATDAVDARVAKVEKTGQETHVIVNQQRTDMVELIAYQKQVIDQLRAERDEKENRVQSQG